MSTTTQTIAARPRTARPPRKRALWRDPQGRISALKSITLVALTLPAIVILTQWSLGMLGPRANTQAIHGFGLWTIRLLWLTLAISPLTACFGWPRLLLIRRMLGVATAIYGAAHLALYIYDEQFDMLKVATEIAIRFYLTIGFVALLGLAALAITSTDGWVKKLRANWLRLHRLIYPIALLALWHMALQSKSNVSEAVWMAGILSGLLILRLIARSWRTRQITLWPLALASALIAAGAEAGWYALRNHIDPGVVFATNFDPDYGIRSPLGAGLVVAAIAVISLTLRVIGKRPL